MSPILGNIYLHYVLDEWFTENWNKHGEVVHYAVEMAAANLRGHYQYYGITNNQPKLNHYYATIHSLFKWLNRRNQKRSFTWERFSRRLMFKSLPKPTENNALLDITIGLIPKLKHKLRSRLPKSGRYGSYGGANRQRFAFT